MAQYAHARRDEKRDSLYCDLWGEVSHEQLFLRDAALLLRAAHQRAFLAEEGGRYDRSAFRNC